MTQLDAELAKDTAAGRADEARPQDAIYLETDILQAHPPADTEVARRLIATVIGADDLGRKTVDRELEIVEGQREVAELLTACDHDSGDRIGSRRLAAGI